MAREKAVVERQKCLSHNANGTDDTRESTLYDVCTEKYKLVNMNVDRVQGTEPIYRGWGWTRK